MEGLLVSAPLLGAVLLTGLVVSVFQAATQINEQTLSFIPKLMALAAVLVVAGPWMLAILTDFMQRLFSGIRSWWAEPVISLTSAQIEALMGAFLWPFVRVLALVMAAPGFGHRAFPRRARIGLALLITAVLVPTLPPSPPITGAGAFLLLAQQLLIGIALGFAMHVAFAAVQLAGDMIGLQMGLSFGNYVDPQHSGQSPVLGMMLGLLGTLVFFAIDGHLMLIAALAESFRLAPVGAESLWGARWSGLVAWGGELFRIGLHLALPVLAAMLAVNIALGVLTRAAPQLNLFSVGFPAALIAGFAMLALLLPYLGGPIQAVLLEALQVPLR